jgi:hypothetical protein
MIKLFNKKTYRTGQCEIPSGAPMARTMLFVALCMPVLFVAIQPSAFAQLTTADILGTVTDATGAVVPNATLTLRNLDTNVTRKVTSASAGEYQFSLLPVGRYSVTVAMPGFKTSVASNLSVEAGDRARADIKLETGGQTETITVEAQTPLLQADSATVSSTVTAQSVQDLPLNGRNFVQLVQLVPGANEGPGNGLTSGGRPDDRRSSSSISVNGQDDTLNNFVIDGIDDNERVIGSIGVKPNVESIQEVTVQTNSYAAEAGRTAGGVINIVTRSGTNTFHGSAYEFFRNDIFDSRNVLKTTGRKPELRQNQFGGSLGGFIFRDRTFFSADYEGFRQVNGLTYQSTIPTIDEYNNINSLNGGSPQALIAAGAGTQGLAVDPIALNYLKLFPAPNTGAPGQLTNNFTISPNRTQIGDSYDVRIDHKINDRNQLFVRYSNNKVDTFTPQALGTQNGLQISGGRFIFSGPATSKAQQYALGYTRLLTQNLVLDLRAAYTRINNLSLPLNYGTNPDTTVGFGANMNFNALSSFLTPIRFGPFSDIGDGAFVPLQDIDNTFQYAGFISYTRGRHNLKAGGSYIRRQARNLQSSFAAGQYAFGLISDNAVPRSTSPADVAIARKQTQDNQLASSLVGAFASDSRNYDLIPPDYRTTEPSGFVQDSWKVNQKLTLLLGVRYDVFTPFSEAHNRISNFDYIQALGSTAGNVGSALKVANVGGVDAHAGLKTDYSNLAPRIGFAFSASPTTVVRGGYGLSFFPGNYTSNASLKNAPFVSVFSPNCQSSLAITIEGSQGTNPNSVNPDCAKVPGAPTTFDAGLPLPAAQSITSPSLSFVAEDGKFRTALIQQFNLQVEQQFGANVLTIGYVGNVGQHLPETINDINVPKPFDPTPGSAGYGTGARPLSTLLPNLRNVSFLQSEGISNYSALQTSFQRRFTHGLAFDANYTWAKAMSDITGFSAEGGGRSWGNADPTRIGQLEYGVAENDIAHRFALSLNYELQYGKNFTGIKKFALSGYHFNTISVWQSGKPFDITNGGGTQRFNNRATSKNSAGPDRPNQISDARLSNKAISISGASGLYFNPAAFTPQALGTIGTTQRNALFGPHFRHIDMSVFKDFPVTERLSVQFRAEAFNISNTPSYEIFDGSGNVQIGNPNFGQATATDSNYNPRIFQFALKAQF